VVPAYVTERCMPGVVVLYEGAWMDLDKNGVDRSGNPDFLTWTNPARPAPSPTTPSWST
jgi:anaerobic dimethyl sulfoxide reductase subunit A